MRINPLLLPLMAVLALPFAFGFADSAALGNTRPVAALQHQIPYCNSCAMSSTINKEEAIYDVGCAFSTQGQYPYSVQLGTCQRYQCANGYYYAWSGWSDSGLCSDTPESTTPCPTGTCAPQS